MDAVAIAAGYASFFGMITTCVYFDQRGKTRRRQMEHTERMRAIELGRPLDDEGVARYRALRAMGVAVPIACLSAAAIGSAFATEFKREEFRLMALALVWCVNGLVCVGTMPFVLARLREGRPGAAGENDADNPDRE